MISKCSRLASLLVIFGATVVANAQVIIVQPGGTFPRLPGGAYGGPGDTVPPGGGQIGPCSGFVCDTPPTTCGTSVCPATWTPFTVPGCWTCPPCSEGTFTLEGYNMTLEDLLNLTCSPESDACTDANGNMSIEITSFSGACEATAVISGWLLHGTFADMPIGTTVPVLACVNGHRMCGPPSECAALGVNCRTIKRSRCLQCAASTVTLTFNRDCMCDALTAWQTYLLSIGQWDQYKDKWMLNVGFTTCNSCD